MEKVRKELDRASKERDELTLSVLRMLSSVLHDKEKRKRYSLAGKGLSEEGLESASRLSDDEALETIVSEAKKRKESIEAFRKAGREDRATREEEELKVLEKYLPERISPEELEELVKKAIEETGAKERRDIGKVMARVMPLVKGRADGSDISSLANRMLS